MDKQTGNTQTRILDVAEELIQSRGYNAVSFRDLAARIGIKAASIHYYFPSKGALAAALVNRYVERYAAERQKIDQHTGPVPDKLRRYIKLLADSFRATGRMCLCGVLAAETSTLPGEVVAEVRRFFEDNEAWLAANLEIGRRRGELHFAGPATEAAKALFAALEGALMSAWTFGDERRLAAAAKWALAPLIGTA